MSPMAAYVVFGTKVNPAPSRGFPTLTRHTDGVLEDEEDVAVAEAAVTDCANEGTQSSRLAEIAIRDRIVNILAG